MQCAFMGHVLEYILGIFEIFTCILLSCCIMFDYTKVSIYNANTKERLGFGETFLIKLYS